jgi:hypothetical protein
VQVLLVLSEEQVTYYCLRSAKIESKIYKVPASIKTFLHVYC